MEGVLAQASRDPDPGWFRDWGLSIIVTLAVAVVLTIVIQVFVRRFRRKLEGSPSLTQELNLQRIATLTGALSTAGLVATWTIAIVVVRVAYGEDVDRVRGILEDLFEELRLDETLSDWVREGPSVLGIETLSDYALVVRVIADTRPSKRWDTERALRERIAGRLDAEGIRVPLPPGGPRPGEPRA